MIAIFGLGNPGKKYENTRHNIGFLVAEELARRIGASFRGKFAWQAEVAEGAFEEKRMLLVKPQTFMNLSGETARAVFAKTSAKPETSLVVYDDADLPFGKIRFRAEGSAGGQNGMKSILEVLPAETKLARVRVGIGRPENEQIPLEDWVLGAWSPEERKTLDATVKAAADEALRWCRSVSSA